MKLKTVLYCLDGHDTVQRVLLSGRGKCDYSLHATTLSNRQRGALLLAEKMEKGEPQLRKVGDLEKPERQRQTVLERLHKEV